ncbi:uncharacterized protein B0H18DRAFT_1113537 [Fomitopsis serialis]|uniref:uncharacterized protein n=1 Tax=Fomitopsis serialis TaxID=139415 RepID=UPI002007AE65|nr:uncharacterized protein B0H18DRAFT_1113537 [Neoantrodia serialis]KAH9936085.1 hypothetical protein B0H18DRAFT_1113537 [Neoantrodia serialis]
MERESRLSELDDEFPATKKRTPQKKAKQRAADVESPLTELEGGEGSPVTMKRARRTKTTEPVVCDVPFMERNETKSTGLNLYMLSTSQPEGSELVADYRARHWNNLTT